MSLRSDMAFDSMMTALLDDLSRGGDVHTPVEAAIERTSSIRQRPRWLASRQAGPRPLLWTAPNARLVAVGLLLLVALIAILLAAGTHRRPPPFGPAGNGAIAYEAGGHVWLAAPDGGSAHQVTFGSTTELAPVWSRDGTRLAYRRLSANEPAEDPTRFTDLVVVNADGSNPVTIVAEVVGLSNPSWSPDSQSLAFTRAVAEGVDHLVVASADGSKVEDLGDLGGSPWGPVWAPDGVRIALGVDNHVVVVNRDGSEPAVVSLGTYVEVGGQAVIGDWSPDGAAFVFTAGTPDDTRIYLTELDGTRERRIDAADRNESDPSWSPDGSLIAYLRSAVGRGPVVVIADRSGRYVRTLPGYYAWTTPAWSPDGTRILVFDHQLGPDDSPGPGVVLALDPAGVLPPIELAAPAGPVANDNIAGSWQRTAP